MKSHPPGSAIQRARTLRRNATTAERRLWALLRETFPEARFRRQVPIRHYIVDFASHTHRLVIEVDGGQHNEAVDGARTATIEQEGYTILRFWNNDVLGNSDGVVAEIAGILPQHHPTPTLPIKGREFDQSAAPLRPKASPLMGEVGGGDAGHRTPQQKGLRGSRSSS